MKAAICTLLLVTALSAIGVAYGQAPVTQPFHKKGDDAAGARPDREDSPVSAPGRRRDDDNLREDREERMRDHSDPIDRCSGQPCEPERRQR